MYGRVQHLHFHFPQVCPQARDTRSAGWNNYCCGWSGKTIVAAGWENYCWCRQRLAKTIVADITSKNYCCGVEKLLLRGGKTIVCGLKRLLLRSVFVQPGGVRRILSEISVISGPDL